MTDSTGQALADDTGMAGAPVSVRDIYKAYGSVRAVNGVSLDIAPGEFVALLGPSGSGKTTLLMAIAGFETPDSGEILIDGRDIVPQPPHKRGIGMVFQRYALFPHMTVAQNIAFPLRMRKVPKADQQERVERALALVRLSGYGDRRVNQLSGGQQQRVAMARAIVFDPPVLLMDEPLGALDKRLREEMQIELKHIQRQLRTTVIYVTHDQAEALTMADRIAVISDGLVQQFAPPAEVYERPTNAFVAGFVGETNFIDGTLERAEPGSWRLRLAGGPAVALAGEEPSWRVGAPARMAIRPESMRLDGEASSGPLLGRVEETIYGGGTLACIVRITDHVALTVREAAAEGRLRRTGDEIAVSWPAERSRVFVT